jgi:hypothetical protein
MKKSRILTLCVLSLGLWACHQPGPAERAGQRVDAIRGNQDRDAQKAGRDIDKATEDARKARKDLER